MSIIRTIRKQLSNQEIILIMFLIAFSLYKFPLQHYITLARFQHYGICLFVWSMGFFMQAIWSWRRMTALGRSCQIATGIYVCSFALIFYQSPWLDIRMAVQTPEQDILREIYGRLCAFLGLIVSLIWLFWILERQKSDEIQKTDEPEI